jgi:hypothetical protein
VSTRRIHLATPSDLCLLLAKWPCWCACVLDALAESTDPSLAICVFIRRHFTFAHRARLLADTQALRLRQRSVQPSVAGHTSYGLLGGVGVSGGHTDTPSPPCRFELRRVSREQVFASLAT